ncbi:helix-turn-helix transcriptional regulator [Streptomyces sp. NPDC005180]|uniref:helix-turn-helix domain-containing protein n=1 Tax=Streptomyces sp. NPDC005180 TaxID=3156868 RepID=UPI0033B565E7
MPRPTPPPHVVARRRRIGAQIRAARLEKRLTQEKVALAIEMDRATYIRIEQGRASPLLDSLIRIADALGVPLSHLVRD